MVQPRSGQGSVQIALRLPPSLRDRIRDAAEKNGRSMNSEIVSTLEQVYPPRSISIEELSAFLESLIGVTAPDGDKEWQDEVMKALSKTKMGWAVEAGWDGKVSFVAHVNHEKPEDEKHFDE